MNANANIVAYYRNQARRLHAVGLRDIAISASQYAASIEGER